MEGSRPSPERHERSYTARQIYDEELERRESGRQRKAVRRLLREQERDWAAVGGSGRRTRGPRRPEPDCSASPLFRP